MKIPSIKVTAQSIRNRRGILAGLITILVFFNVLPKAWGADLFWAGNATTLPAAADSGTWTTNTFTGTPNSWSPSSTSFANSVWVQGSLAHFLGSGGGTITLDTNITAAGINFDPGASAFTINTNGNTFSIQGAGIVNNSGQAQTITNNDRGNIETGFFDGFTDFINASTAGSATITNNGGQSGQRGFTNFQNTSTAGNATITNNGGLGSGGFTDFINASTAGSATIINNGGTANAVFSGRTEFHNASTAGNATITNNAAAAGAGGAAAGSTIFFNASNAGSATITNDGGAVVVSSGGLTQFQDMSSAGSATITNNAAAVGASSSGRMEFFNTSTAGSATITNNGAATGGAFSGSTIFFNASNAGSATIANSGGAVSGASGGSTSFVDASSASSATIINNGGAVSGASGGLTQFEQLTSSAGSATIINNGGAVSGASGGLLLFLNASTAGSATITSNGGTGGGLGGRTEFDDNSDGGTARAITNGNGSFDISRLITTGMGIGSIAGSGNYFLGSKTLTVGGNNSSTTVSGVIQDGGLVPSAGGSLTKVGTGTLTLTGVNTYTGITTINAGVLTISQDANLGITPGTPAPNHLTFNGGTLQATATFTLNTNRGITLNAGAGTFDVTDANMLTYGGVITGPGSLTKVGTGTLTLLGSNTFSGVTTITAGTLQLGNGGTTGSITGDVANNGVLVFDRSNVLTFGGVISGAGSIQHNGTGTTVLVGDNSYSGGTTIGGGTLQLGNGGTLGSIVGDVTNNGVLAFNRSDIVTFPGVISGTGSVIQAGTGTTILTGTNSYTGGTTITAGTLQLGDGGATGSILGNVANNGVLVFDRSNVLTFGGVISGAGSVAQIGTGTTILAGNNTYTGGTTVSAGTLQAGSANGFSHNSEFTVNSTLDLNGFNNTIGSLSGAGTVLNNGPAAAALTVGGDNDNSIFAGVLQNGTSSLQLTKSGTDTLILTGTNLYTGGTTISIGMLQLGNGGTAGSVIGDVLDNGTLAFNRSNSVTFGGVIRGTGNVVNMGPGTLILTGANTYTGGTAINTGTLQLGNGGTTGSIAGNVIDNGTLAFNRSDSVTFAGVISGTGNVVKLGSGTLTLPGANTYTGSTTINNGSLIVNGSLASTQTVINPGGSLGGHGTVGGNLINNGIVSQASSPGTLTVVNNFTQNASGTLRIGVAGVALGQHDLLAVNGHAALAGTLQLFPLTGFNLQPGDQITFLTAKNGVSGSFANAQNGLVSTGTILEVQVRSLANSVVLETVQGSFASTPEVAPTQNTQAVAKALDSAAGDPREAALFAFLNSQPLANLPHDLELIAPAQITSLNATAVSVSNVQTSNIGQRLANVHAGSTGFSSAGFSITGSAASFGEGFAGPTGSEGKSAPPVFAPTPNNRWGVFVTGLGEFTNVDSTPNAAGYNVDTGGFTLGVDYRLTPTFAIGLTVGYAHTSVHPDGGGNIDVNGGKIGAYATFFGNGFYLDTAVSGGPNGYNTHRAALQGAANGSTDGADFDFLVATGYDWQKGNLTIGPTASFQYNYVGLQSFTETGSLAPLTFPDQNTQSERTAFGAKVSYEWKVGNVTVLPQVSTAWQHEFGATAYSVIASFASGAGNSFSVFGPNIGRDSLLVGAGATVILNERVSTYLYYDGEFARTNYLSNNVSTGVRISF